MKRKISGWIDLLAASVNYIVICVALSHMEIPAILTAACFLIHAGLVYMTWDIHVTQ